MTSLEKVVLHDAEIIAVAVDRLAGYARLDFRLTNGSLHFAQLHNLKAFRGEDLTLQNIISRMLRSSKGQISRENLEYWLGWVTSLSDVGTWLNEEGRVEWLRACEAGTLELVVFEPSTGAQIAAVCERLNLS